MTAGRISAGAAPLVFSDHVSLPWRQAFPRVYKTFAERFRGTAITVRPLSRFVAAKAATQTREGLADGVFFDLFKKSDFILNRTPWDAASILICGENFGCGSSREYAVWGLMQRGIRTIIAPSFAGIFFGNCEKNGLLAITLPAEDVARLGTLASDADTSEMGIDLPEQVIRHSEGVTRFDIPLTRKTLLLEGKDHVAGTLEHVGAIDAYEKVMSPDGLCRP